MGEWWGSPAWIAAALLMAGCATRPTFEDIPAQGAGRDRVLIESRIGTEDQVKTICYWKAREGGVKPAYGPPGCTFMENGVRVILWVDPGSFNNHEALEVAGHELFHWHNRKDHR